jgi:hypothetical protein
MTTTTATSELLIRQEIWQDQIKETLKDELMAMSYVDWVDFPDGETMTIPSVGDMLSKDYTENTAVDYQALDTGEFQFSITEYKQSGTYITKKNLQDSFYMDRIMSTFPSRQERSIMEAVEAKIYKDPEDVMGTSATASYDINGLAHRFSCGLDDTNNVIDLADFSYAKLALEKANVPLTNLIAIVPSEVEHKLNTLTNIVSVSDNPMWQGILETGLSTGTRFIRNIFGFDVYVSNRLTDSNAVSSVPNALPHRDGSTAGPNFNSVAGKACLFFSAAQGDIVPWIGSVRQAPELDMEYNKDWQRWEMVTTMRYGSKLYRPENMVIGHTQLVVS